MPALVNHCVKSGTAKMRRDASRFAAGVLLLAGFCISGCSQPQLQTGAGASREENHARLGSDVDPEKAFLPLAEVPPDIQLAPPNSSAAVEASRPTQRRMSKARELIAEQRYTEAISDLEKALRYDPIYAPLYRLLGVACRRSGSLGRATSFLEKALVFAPGDGASHYQLGMTLAEAGQDADALQHLRQAWICPSDEENSLWRPLVAVELARRMEANGYLSAALELYVYFEAARSRKIAGELTDPDEVDFVSTGPEFAAMHIGQIQERLGRLEEASSAYGRARTYAPNDLVVQAGSARLLMRMGREKEARALTRRLLASANTQREWDEIRGLYESTGNSSQFQEDLRALADVPDPSERVLEALFEIIRSTSDDKGIEVVLSKLLAKRADDADTYGRAIEYYLARGDVSRIHELLAHALTGHASRIVVLSEAIDRVSQNQISPKTTEELRRALRSPVVDAAELDVSVGYLMVRLALRQGNEDAAQTWLENATRLESPFLPASVLLGELRVEQARWRDAVDLIASRATPEGPLFQDPEAFTVLARAYDGLDDFARAEDAWQRVQALRHNDARAFYAMGRMLERKGESLRARRQYQSALAVRPALGEAHEALVRNFLYYQGELRLAAEQLQQMQHDVGEGVALSRCRALWEFYNSAGTTRQSRRAIAREYVGTLEKIATDHPNDLRTRVDQALVLGTQLREYEQAAGLLDKVLAVSPRDAQALELRVLMHRKLLEFPEAASLLETMLNLHPNRESWMRQMFDLRLSLQQYDRALAVVQHLIAHPLLQDDARQYRGLLLDALFLAGRHSAAIEAVRGWEPVEGDDGEERTPGPSWRYQLILRLIHAGATDLALQQSVEWYESMSMDPLAREMLLVSLVPPLAPQVVPPPTAPIDSWAGGRYAEINPVHLARARRLVLSWLEDDPEDPRLQYRMINLLALNEDKSGAVELARNWHAGTARVHQMSDNDWFEYEALAESLMDAELFDEAIRMYKQRARATEQIVRAQQAALAMINARQFDEAERYLLNLEERVGGSSQQKIMISQMLYQCYLSADEQKRGEERLQELLRDLEEDSYVPDSQAQDRYLGVCNDLGYFWADQGRNLDQAEELIRLALGSAPRRSAYLDSLGWVRYKKGDFDSAIKWLSAAVSAGLHQDAIVVLHLGDAQWRAGQKEQAVDSWRSALGLFEAKLRHEELGPEEARSIEGVRDRLRSVEDGNEPDVSPVVSGENDNA